MEDEALCEGCLGGSPELEAVDVVEASDSAGTALRDGAS